MQLQGLPNVVAAIWGEIMSYISYIYYKNPALRLRLRAREG